MWDEITYPFPNFSGCIVEVLEWIRNFTQRFIMDVISYPYRYLRLPILVKGASDRNISLNVRFRLWALKLFAKRVWFHYIDIIMTTRASQTTSLTVVYSTVYSDADRRKHQSSASLAFVWGIHRDRWIPRTKGQLRGKCFHLMTSSCLWITELALRCQCSVWVPMDEYWWIGCSVWHAEVRTEMVAHDRWHSRVNC